MYSRGAPFCSIQGCLCPTELKVAKMCQVAQCRSNLRILGGNQVFIWQECKLMFCCHSDQRIHGAHCCCWMMDFQRWTNVNTSSQFSYLQQKAKVTNFLLLWVELHLNSLPGICIHACNSGFASRVSETCYKYQEGRQSNAVLFNAASFAALNRRVALALHSKCSMTNR